MPQDERAPLIPCASMALSLAPQESSPARIGARNGARQFRVTDDQPASQDIADERNHPAYLNRASVKAGPEVGTLNEWMTFDPLGLRDSTLDVLGRPPSISFPA